MKVRILHRGPDDTRSYADSYVGLGNQRLSIIDISALGHQPMANLDGNLWITFNGEIHNFPTRRKAVFRAAP